MGPYLTQRDIGEKIPLIRNEQSNGEGDSSNLETQKIAKCLGIYWEEQRKTIS